MNFEVMHPAEQLCAMIDRVYSFGMTTTSGGNLSVMDAAGDIWITPGGIDKGTLSPRDIVQVKPDGTAIGIHRASVELPVHRKIYETRPDIKAILHAHPPALVAYSALAKKPQTEMIANIDALCNNIQTVGYALPGSDKLVGMIADRFGSGADIAMMVSHGVIVGANNLKEAFMKFEMLDFCARIEIASVPLGAPRTLSREVLDAYMVRTGKKLEEFGPEPYSSEERLYREELCRFVHRAYRQQVFTSMQGSYSRKISDHSFIITPHGEDRLHLRPEDMVTIKYGRRERGKNPSYATKMHQAIYEQNPDIKAVMVAQPPSSMAFAVTGAEFNARLIPESYMMLKDVQRMPYGANTREPETVAKAMSIKYPVMIIENDYVITVGKDTLNAFDRMEVMEYSAKAIVAAKQMGAEMKQISEEEVKEIEIAFNL